MNQDKDSFSSRTLIGDQSTSRPIPSRPGTMESGSLSFRQPTKNVHYIEINSPMIAKDRAMDTLQFRNASPLANSGAFSTPSSRLFAGDQKRCASYGFVPIKRKEDGHYSGHSTPPVSPFTMQKPRVVSPSVMSTLTEDSNETASMTLDSRTQTPTTLGTVSPTDWESNKERRSPYLKKEEDDTRKQRIKTELCMHWSAGRVCPFGAECTYAHGEEELQMTKLMDLHEAGLVDKDTYRIKPCFTWVATGSCPFGKRCCGIHDPRVGGRQSSWLPLTETQGNTITTDINVECLHQKRNNAILNGHPFGNQFCLKTDSWTHLYRLVCDLYNSSKRRGRKAGQKTVPEIVKLQIALMMRGSNSDWQYKYRPQHVIFEEQCMVLQKRAFYVTADLAVREISMGSYNSRIANHVIVHEIAFGPDDDSSVRGVALWFNIREEDVSQCTAAQARRFRWKRPVKKDGFDLSHHSKLSLFESIESFNMIRPHDKESFDLATDMIKHRLRDLLTERTSSMRHRFEKLKLLESETESLEKRFQGLRKHWLDWEWPLNAGREYVNKNTPVPQVDSLYDIAYSGKALDSHGVKDGASYIKVIWDSFTLMAFDELEASDTLDDKIVKILFGENPATNQKSRLRIFETLALGLPSSEDRAIPHIKRSISQVQKQGSDVSSGERCWRALLLPNKLQHESNEWEIVRDHFMKSRSIKVLKILQDNITNGCKEAE